MYFLILFMVIDLIPAFQAPIGLITDTIDMSASAGCFSLGQLHSVSPFWLQARIISFFGFS
jgi:hypothetical protein